MKKRKQKSWESKLINEQFRTNSKDVFSQFKQIIEADKDSEKPVYKKIVRQESKCFDDEQEVVNFWSGIWEKDDTGNAEAPWLNEIEETFRNIIPAVNQSVIEVTESEVFNAVRKKKNWSAPGPDLIVNFWWKKVTSTHPVFKNIVTKFINNAIPLPTWFCLGKVTLIPKDGEWSVPNHRPITCTNNMYKWYTSIILLKLNKHLNDNYLMQIDQRGGKAKCTGTVDNLLIDDAVLNDARIHHRNLSCAWIDVRKAFDSLSHSYLKKIIDIHRTPTNLARSIKCIMDNWSVYVNIPTANGIVTSRIIKFTNGELQGDSLGPTLYNLAKNPISWKIRQHEGYTLSAPVKKKITHTLFIDDLKKYNRSKRTLKDCLEMVRSCMADAGLLWNEGKCKCVHLKNGKFAPQEGDITLKDSFVLKCLQHEEVYKFLGVPEGENYHDIVQLTEKLLKTVSQRANVIWTSPLSDYNKVIACNMFINSTVEYFFSSEKFRLEDLRKMDIAIRDAMNRSGAKHSQQKNEVLYMPKVAGGRGLRQIEQTYKETRIKAAMRILKSKDERMLTISQFHRNCMSKSHGTILKDATTYASEMNIELEISENSFIVRYNRNGNIMESQDVTNVKDILMEKRNEMFKQAVRNCTWQGVIFNTRYMDTTLAPGCFEWLRSWKNAPTDVIREIYDLYCQTLKTKCFESIRCTSPPSDTICRLCKNGQESVKHILNNCSTLAKQLYMNRHNQVLKCFVFQVLKVMGFIEKSPAWYTQTNIKPYYENENACIWWDIPEYAGSEDNIEDSRLMRPDGKVLVKQSKEIFILEMTCPWIDVRDERYEAKREKYQHIRYNIARNNPGFKVDQITLVMDSLGGYSNNLKENIYKLISKKSVPDNIILNMQKAVLAHSVHISRRFKIGQEQ